MNLTREQRLVVFAKALLSGPSPEWLRLRADIALHGWPKETGGAQTPEVAARMERDWKAPEAPRG